MILLPKSFLRTGLTRDLDPKDDALISYGPIWNPRRFDTIASTDRPTFRELFGNNVVLSTPQLFDVLPLTARLESPSRWDCRMYLLFSESNHHHLDSGTSSRCHESRLIMLDDDLTLIQHDFRWCICACTIWLDLLGPNTLERFVGVPTNLFGFEYAIQVWIIGRSFRDIYWWNRNRTLYQVSTKIDLLQLAVFENNLIAKSRTFDFSQVPCTIAGNRSTDFMIAWEFRTIFWRAKCQGPFGIAIKWSNTGQALDLTSLWSGIKRIPITFPKHNQNRDERTSKQKMKNSKNNRSERPCTLKLGIRRRNKQL